MEENSTFLNEANIGSPHIMKTPKSQKNNTDVRRWASVVKAHKSILNSPEVKLLSEKDETSDVFDCLPDIISENYVKHKGFITLNKNSFFCQICSFDLDTMLSLTNHLKTRKHEDNIIVFLKDKLPSHLEHTMEYVSFCKSDLCCNLCQETIDMSLNPHETLLNIIAHNTDITHVSLRASHDELSPAHKVLNILSETHPEIMENSHLVDKKAIPQFKCKLCNKNINYNENFDLLGKHFISHFKSLGHVKNQKAVEVLTLFDEVSLHGKEKFVVVNGNILCTVCNGQVETDVEKLILHVKEVEHASHSLAELKLFSSTDAKIEKEENEISSKNSFVFNQIFETEEIKKDKSESEDKIKPSTKLNRLMSTLPSDLRKVDYLIENDKGSVTCLMCDCVVPPCKHNLLIHLNGSNHQRKMESVKDDKETKNQRSSSLTVGCSCLRSNDQFSKSILNIPKDLRVYRCKRVNPSAPASIYDDYCLLLKKNFLISSYKNVLVINVDRKNCYCKLCKSLIPLSSNISDLEKNLVSHYNGMTHVLHGLKNLWTKLDKGKMTPFGSTIPIDSSSTGKVVRSLFVLPDGGEKKTADTDNFSTSSLEKESPEATRSLVSSKKTNESEVFVFGKSESNKPYVQENLKNINIASKITKERKALPITKTSCSPPFELEVDEAVLSRRQKQLDYGKNTEGYARYCKAVPLKKRRPTHPVTPPKHLKSSRRTWDGMVKVWRKKLHAWDLPVESTSLEKDIQPLPLK